MQQLHWLMIFFNSDEVSRMMPGKADATRVTKGQKVQTRILNDYLSNCYPSFKYKYPSVQLSFSQFCKLCPSHVRLTKFLSRNSCLCAKHQNMALKLKALKSLSVNPEHVDGTAVREALSQLTEPDVSYDSGNVLNVQMQGVIRFN